MSSVCTLHHTQTCVPARRQKKAQLTPIVSAGHASGLRLECLVTWTEPGNCYHSPYFLWLTLSTHIQRRLFHLAIHHHKDSKQAFVPGSVLRSGSYFLQVSTGKKTETWTPGTDWTSFTRNICWFFSLFLWFGFLSFNWVCLIKPAEDRVLVNRTEMKMCCKCNSHCVLQIDLLFTASTWDHPEDETNFGDGQLGETGTHLYKTTCSKTKITMTSGNLCWLLGRVLYPPIPGRPDSWRVEW